MRGAADERERGSQPPSPGGYLSLARVGMRFNWSAVKIGVRLAVKVQA